MNPVRNKDDTCKKKISNGVKIISESVADTLSIGKKIARYLHKGDIVCLFGELGSGKTVLVKGIAQGLGVKKDKVTSPSFVLMQRYTGAKIPLYHFDFYRLKTKDICNLGYEDYLYADGITVIEWPQRFGFLLPKTCLKIELAIVGETKRLINLPAAVFPHPPRRG